MKRIILGLASGLAAMTMATSAYAATFTVTFGNTKAVPANNDFDAPELSGLGLTRFTDDAAKTVTVSGPAKVTFHYLGSESSFTDRFNWGGSAPGNYVEADGNSFGAPLLMGSTNVGAGALSVFFDSLGGGINAPVSSIGFGVFLDANNAYNPNVLYFGYDDQNQSPDDNHDDFIVRATISAIPEPANWLMMVVGFGLVGATLRSRAGVRRAIA